MSEVKKQRISQDFPEYLRKMLREKRLREIKACLEHIKKSVGPKAEVVFDEGRSFIPKFGWVRNPRAFVFDPQDVILTPVRKFTFA